MPSSAPRRARTTVWGTATVALIAVLTACGAPERADRAATPSAPGTVVQPASGSVAVVEGPIETNAVVVRVVDGDTLRVERQGQEDTIRLIGMDTPETKKPNTAVECFGHEASEHLVQLVPAGTRLRLERDAEERDRYDRILAYVYREDGLFVNLAMVADGYAGQLTVPPNVAHADAFTAAARVAREQDKGLWSACGGVHVASP